MALRGHENSGQKRSKPATLRGTPALTAALAAGATFRQAAVTAGLVLLADKASACVDNALDAGDRKAALGPEKGTGTICWNGPQGASHKWSQSPFSRPAFACWRR